MSERKLATIRKITELKSIKGADRIELAKVDGWQCITKKSEFKVGDLGIYFEIDSLLNKNDIRFDFLGEKSIKTSDNGKSGYRLKTIRMKKELSQGLLLPLSMFPEIKKPKEGLDVTKLLLVDKWELPQKQTTGNQMLSIKKRNFPNFIRKTDEERIENKTEYFEKYKNVSFEATVKMDGSSCTFFLNKKKFGVCSRNIFLQQNNEGFINKLKMFFYKKILRKHIEKIDKTNNFIKMSEVLNIETLLKENGKNIAIQGELVGQGIQKNKSKIDGLDFYVFNIFNIDTQKYMLPNERDFTCKVLGLKQCPIKDESIKIFQVCNTMEKIKKYAEGKNPIGNTEQEGIVFKSLEYIDGRLLSFKSINNKYLLKD